MADLTVGVAGAAFWDFAKYAYAKVLGAEADAQSPAGRRVIDRIEPTMGDLTDVLIQPVREMHRPIQEDPEIKLDLIRPRVGTILTFDHETLQRISGVIDAPDDVLVSGNITRYNILTGYGRLYDDNLEQTVPFEVVRTLSRAKRVLLTESLNEGQQANGGKLFLTASVSRDHRNETVKYIVKDVINAAEADEDAA